MPLQKNMTLQVTGDSHYLGVGQATIDDTVITIPNLLTGEVAEILIVKVTKQAAYGKVLELISSHPSRVEAPCSIAKACGGCTAQHVAEFAQRDEKMTFLNALLTSLSQPETILKPMIYHAEASHYRSKAQFAVRWSEDGVQLGLYAPRSVRVVDALSCYIQHSKVNQLLDWHREYFNKQLSDYDSASWPIQHLVIRVAPGTDQVLVALVADKRADMFKSSWQRALLKSGLADSLYWNYNADPGNTILAPGGEHLDGSSTINASVNGITYRLGLHTFFSPITCS